MENLTEFYAFIDTTPFKEVMTNLITLSILYNYKVYIHQKKNMWIVYIERKNWDDRIAFKGDSYSLISEIILEYFDIQNPALETSDPILFNKALNKLLEEL